MAAGSRPWAPRTSEEPAWASALPDDADGLLAERIGAASRPTAFRHLGQSVLLLIGDGAALASFAARGSASVASERRVIVGSSSPRSRIAQAATTRTTSSTPRQRQRLEWAFLVHQ